LLDECEATESEFIEMTMRLLNLTEGFRVTEAGIRLYTDSECNEQRTAAGGQRIVRMIAFLL
jgi:hypothetical protein